MNRELKFRVWFSEESRFLETKDGLFFKYPHNDYGEYIGDFIRDPYFVQQYTGIKDKHGREIYEGDILTGLMIDWATTRTFVVSFDVEEGGYRWYQWALDSLEIIGNVFENPELLGVSR